MDANVDYLLKLLHSILNDEPAPEMGAEVEWNKLMMAAGMGEVTPLLYSKLSQVKGSYAPTTEQLAALQNYSITTGMRKIQTYELLARVLGEAKDRGIQVVIFKGPVLAMLYPEPMLRPSCDVDLYVDPKDLPEMEKLLVDLGFTKNEKHSKKEVPVYVYGKRLMIEAHCCLFEDHTGKRIQQLKAMNLVNPEHLVQVSACGLEVTTLGYEEHLVFLVFHLVKHIGYSGCSLKTILDIVLFVNAYAKFIDKEAFWQKMKLLSYDNFCRTLFSIGCYYFGMTKEIFIDNSYSESIAETTMRHMYETGILKASSASKAEDRRAASIAYQSLQGKEDKKVGKFRMWKKTFFPSSKDLSFRYMYARRHPTLVWVAWIHRAFNNLTVRLGHKDDERISMIEDMKLANQKLSLLKELDLMRKD